MTISKARYGVAKSGSLSARQGARPKGVGKAETQEGKGIYFRQKENVGTTIWVKK